MNAVRARLRGCIDLLSEYPAVELERSRPVYPEGVRCGSLLSLWADFEDRESSELYAVVERRVAWAIVSGRPCDWGGLVEQRGLWMFRSDLGMSQVSTSRLEVDIATGKCRVEIY